MCNVGAVVLLQMFLPHSPPLQGFSSCAGTGTAQALESQSWLQIPALWAGSTGSGLGHPAGPQAEFPHVFTHPCPSGF